MPVLSLHDISLAYGHQPLLDGVDFQVAAGERVCLVGRNGAGKSTLLRVISGCAQADEGEVWIQNPLRIAHLEQEVHADTPETVYQVVAKGLGEVGALLTAYHDAAHATTGGTADALKSLADLQHRIEAADGWNISQKVETALTRLSLPADKLISECSGGVRRRVMLAQALVCDPELLLLDEPTNHLDIAAIGWLEEFLLAFSGTLLFITHDRALIDRVATRIVELDRGRLRSFPGDFQQYLRKQVELSAIAERLDAKLDKKLSEEEAWLRQGIKARRTRNEGRVQVLEAMRLKRRQRIESAGRVSMGVDVGELSGKLVADLHHVDYWYEGAPLIKDLSLRILRGDRVGIIGPNGCGKSTLLKLIVGELVPYNGQVVMGARLQSAYFDQQRERLDVNKTVRENIAEGSDYVDVRGRSRHVVGYLKEFLFPFDRIDSPVKILSGGERNRLLLAKLFTRPANMLILDEPTNDLDVDTLELLEALLADYEGTLLLVSHDRTFLDNVVTSTVVFDRDGHVREYVGGYEDWLRQSKTAVAAALNAPRKRTDADNARASATQVPKGGSQTRKADNPKGKLGFNEQRELAALPERIEALEREQQDIEQQLGRADFYQQDKAAISAAVSRLGEIREALVQAYERWTELDAV